MRSSKSRSRSKTNRNRPTGGGSGTNVVNRVFDSSGPEGKVRGTPQQIIDKYNQLARDAQLSNDRVAAENFQQHAEHYMRMLSEAQREQDVRREEQERQNRERQAEQDVRREEQERQNRERQAERDRERTDRVERQENEQVPAAPADPATAPQPDVLDHSGNSAEASNDAGLVETPESAPRKPRRARTRKPAVKPTVKPDVQPDAPAADDGGTPEAAE